LAKLSIIKQRFTRYILFDPGFDAESLDTMRSL